MELIFVGILGLFVGYLVNYVSDVLPLQRKLTLPICTHCAANYSWKDFFLRSTCKSCGRTRPWRFYATLAAGLIFSILLWEFPPKEMGFGLGLLVLAYFGVVIIIDFEHRLILHIVSMVGAVLGLVTGTIRTNFPTAVVGGLVGLAIMLIFYWFGTLFARYRARKLGHDDGEEALGFGDVTISAVLGFMLGWPLIIYGLMIGIVAGGVISLLLVIFLIATRRYESMTIFTAYGPYLVLGAAMLMYFPQYLTILSGK